MEHQPSSSLLRSARARHAFVFLAITIVSALLAGYFAGAPQGRAETATVIALSLFSIGWMPALYLLSAYGLGRVLLRAIAPSASSRSVAFALGFGATLTMTHLLGWLGFLGGKTGPIIAWVSLLPGLVVATRVLVRDGREVALAPSPSRWWWGVAPAFGLILACACSPPGWLWSSEFGGYDALSYHLQLPNEWMQSGRVRVLNHNVYSALPGYTECAFLHQGLLAFPQTTPDATRWGTAMLADDGRALIAAQFLHALLACAASLCTGAAARATLARVPSLSGTDTHHEQVSQTGAVAAALVAFTPWTLVTGSLAYNEMGVLLMGAACAIVLASADFAPIRRWLLCALLIGAACGVKPTALLMLGAPCALVLVVTTSRRDLLKAAPLGALAGVLMLSPWMIRNASATSNPVFPFASRTFASFSGGTGHWSREQADRFARAHSFDGTLSERLSAVVRAQPDPSTPGATRHRGILHPQWGWLFPLTGLGLIALLVTSRGAPLPMRHVTAFAASALLLQLALWLFTTHMQSRFLLPVLPTCALLLAITAGAQPASNLRAGAAIIIVGVQALATYNVFAAEKNGAPLGAVVAGPVVFSGEVYERTGAQVDDEQLGPDHWINLRLPPDSRILLVGDATPLYLRQKVHYATTWDENPLSAIMRTRGDDPEQWSVDLREAGFDFVVLNLAELSRLERSGFLHESLAPSRLKPWIEHACVAVRAWPQQGKFVLRPMLPEEMGALRESMQPGRSPTPPTTAP